MKYDINNNNINYDDRYCEIQEIIWETSTKHILINEWMNAFVSNLDFRRMSIVLSKNISGFEIWSICFAHITYVTRLTLYQLRFSFADMLSLSSFVLYWALTRDMYTIKADTSKFSLC